MTAAKSSAVKKPSAKPVSKKPLPKPPTKKPAPKKPAIKTPVEDESQEVASEIKTLLESGTRLPPKAATTEVIFLPEEQEENLERVDFQNNDGEDEVIETELHKDVFIICKALCMKCVHLCPETGSESPTNCHYDAGNEDCPAKTTVFQLGMSKKEIEKAALAIVESTFSGDFERLNSASQRLARKSESVRASVSNRVLELQAERK